MAEAPARAGWPERKVAQGIHARSSRAVTHLILEVRPSTGQRTALFKKAPAVFVRGAGRFALRTILPALYMQCGLP